MSKSQRGRESPPPTAAHCGHSSGRIQLFLGCPEIEQSTHQANVLRPEPRRSSSGPNPEPGPLFCIHKHCGRQLHHAGDKGSMWWEPPPDHRLPCQGPCRQGPFRAPPPKSPWERRQSVAGSLRSSRVRRREPRGQQAAQGTGSRRPHAHPQHSTSPAAGSQALVCMSFLSPLHAQHGALAWQGAAQSWP